MRKIMSVLRQNEEGVTALEYGLIAALVALLIIGGLTSIGTKLSGVFSQIGASL